MTVFFQQLYASVNSLGLTVYCTLFKGKGYKNPTFEENPGSNFPSQTGHNYQQKEWNGYK
jgi:hypothetical protein